MVPRSIPNGGNFKDNLVFNQLMTQMNPKVVYELSNRDFDISFFTRLLSQKGGAVCNAIYTNEIVSANRGLDFIQATVQTRTVSGSDLVLTFDQPVEAARLGDVAFYGIKWDRIGRVIDKVNGSGGFIKVAPAPGTSAWTGADFPVGSTIGLYGDIRSNTPSGPKERRFLNPTLETNYLATSREGLWNSRYEKQSTRVSTTNATPSVFEFEGQWWTSMQQDMIWRMELSRELDLAFSNKGIQTTSEGEITRNGGIRWSIINRNGVYMPFSTAITRDMIEIFFQEIHVQTLSSKAPFMFFCGMGLWAAITKLYENDIRETGILNTFGGEDVESFNIKKFQVPGVSRDVAIINPQIFNEPLLGGMGAKTTISNYSQYTLGQMTGFVMTDAMFRDFQGNSLPQFTCYHYGPQEFYIGRMKGMDNATGSISQEVFMEAVNSSISSIDEVGTLVDVTELSVLTQRGIDGYGRGCGWIEPTI